MPLAPARLEISGESQNRPPNDHECVPTKSSSKNQIRGKARQIKGKVKEKAGRLARNTRLEGEGLDDQVAGTIQNLGGKIQKKLEE